MNRAWLSTDWSENAARRGGEPGVRVNARSRAGRCALLVLLGALSGALSRAQNLEEIVKRGETVFASTCATGYCHGPKGSPGGAPRLAARGFDQNYIAGTLARGIPGTAMASFAATLSRADFTAVVAYLATLNGMPNGIANPSLAVLGSAPPAPAPTLTPEAARGRALFSDAVRGFGRCSTCHEVNGIGISVATPISEIPASVGALRSLSTPQVSTATANSESMPALLVGNTRRAVIFYDLTTVPPVLRTMDPAAVKIADGASWRHASVIASYNDAELAAILEYLRAAGK
jgi:mono/diheme cytochrome c family protein